MGSIRLSARRASAALVLLMLLLSLGARAQTIGGCVRVTLLQVNDVYQFMPVDRGRSGGLARVSALRKQILKDSPNTLFLLSGDTISPSVESIKLKGQQMIDAWNQIGLDLAALGNHEFDFGPEELLKRMSESRFKWLAANVVDTEGKPFGGMQPFVIRQFQGAKIGFFGLLLPETAVTSRPGPNVRILNSCETARRIVPQMRAAGAQVVVAVTHLSMREDKELAHCVPDIDLIIGGHEHTLLQSIAGRTPIFKMTSDAREMGRFDLTIDARTGKLQSIDWVVIPVNDQVAEDPEFAAVKEKYKEQLATYNEVVGRTSVQLDARSEPNRTGETNIADFIADSFRQAMNADVALINGGMIRADALYEPGPLSKHDVLAIIPFGGQVVKIEVTGATLRKALEHGVGQSAAGAEPGRFPQVSGLRFSFDTASPAGSRVKRVTVNGQPLDDRKLYSVATTTFMAGGGDDYQMLKGARLLTKAGEEQVDYEILRKALSSVQAIAPAVDGRIEWINRPASDGGRECEAAAATTPQVVR